MPFVRVCPKCGSENVKVDPNNPKAAAGFSHPIYCCMDCGCTSPIFPEIERDAPGAGTSPL